jgi:hypothetical protein
VDAQILSAANRQHSRLEQSPEAVEARGSGAHDPPDAARSVPSRVEVAVGAGFARGGGDEAAPSLPVVAFESAWWFSRRWAVAVDYVRTLGEDRRRDRVQRELQHVRALLRYRAPLRRVGAAVIGVGFGGGSWEEARPDTPTPGSSISWGAIGVEGYLHRRVTDRLAVRAGLSIDVNDDTTVVRPAVLAVMTF